MQLVHDAVRAIGGEAAVRGARALTLRGTGEGIVLGQNRSPDSDPLRYRIVSFERSTEMQKGQWRQEQVLQSLFRRQNPALETEITALDGRLAFDVRDGKPVRQSESVARDRRVEVRHSPLGILQAALAPGSVVANRRRVGGFEAVDVRPPDGGVFILSIDPSTRLPVKVSSMTNETVLGDVVVETEFADYRETSGLKLPTRIISRLDGTALATLHVGSAIVNGPVSDLEAPATVRSAPIAPSAPNVTAEELSKGVWLLGGSSHRSLLVEFGDHLLLVEAPWDEARTFAVIAKARALVPSKPLTHVVSTHHHFDHVGGLRAAVSEGRIRALELVRRQDPRRQFEFGCGRIVDARVGVGVAQDGSWRLTQARRDVAGAAGGQDGEAPSSTHECPELLIPESGHTHASQVSRKPLAFPALGRVSKSRKSVRGSLF